MQQYLDNCIVIEVSLYLLSFGDLMFKLKNVYLHLI